MNTGEFPKIVKTKKGSAITLRFPAEGDENQLQRFINELVDEDVPIMKNEKITLKEEKKYLRDLLEDIDDKKSVNLYAFSGNKLIASTGIRAGKFRSTHMGSLGISVSSDFRGEGLGQILMEEILSLAKNRLGLNKVTLAVMDGNICGINLYKKMGFVEYGRLPGAFFYQGNFIGEIMMYKDL